jgi:hypothetical protein
MRIKQAGLGSPQIVQDPADQLGIFTCLKAKDHLHLPVSGCFDHGRVRLEQPDTQQPVMSPHFV